MRTGVFRSLFLSVILAAAASAVLGASGPSLDNIGLYHPLHEELSFDPDFYREGWIRSDDNGDGLTDYAIFLDEDGFKTFEVQDYNQDGLMDDFYHYRRDVLVKQELDQNADGKIDLWIYLSQGVYVAGYERDRDFDGRIDTVKIYGE